MFIRIKIFSALLYKGLFFAALLFFVTKSFAQSDATMEAGMNAYKTGDYKQAVSYFTEVIKSNRKAYQAFYYRAYSNMYLHNWTDALSDLYRIRKPMKNDAGVYLAFGNIYNEGGKYKKALTNFNTALKLNPNLAEAYNNRGVCYQHMHNYRAAIQDYTSAINADPRLATAYNNRGSAIYYNQDVAQAVKLDIESAINDFTKALALDSGFCMARRNRALCYSFLHKDELALSDFNKAIACDPNNALNYLNRGSVKIHMKDDVHGIDDCIQALQMDPKLVEANIVISEGQLHLGYHQEAIRDLEKAIAAGKQYRPKAHYKIACINALDGNKNEMLRNLNEAYKEGYFKDKDNRSAFLANDQFANYKDDMEFLNLRDKIRRE